MEKKLQTSQAVAAHRKWRERLEKAIETGSSEFKPSVVRQDNQCEFGKWLHDEVSAELTQTAEFQQIKQLHVAFHQQAGHILEIALQGQKEEARHLLGSQGNFVKLSEGLVAKLKEWHFNNQDQATLAKSNGQDHMRAILEARASALAKVAETQPAKASRSWSLLWRTKPTASPPNTCTKCSPCAMSRPCRAPPASSSA